METGDLMTRKDTLWLIVSVLLMSWGFQTHHWITFIAGIMISVYALTEYRD